MKKTLLSICMTLMLLKLIAQDLPPCNNVNYNDEVQTVLLFPVGEPLQEPLIELGNMNALSLSFDILGNTAQVLNYTFIHCSHDWQPSDLQRINYVNGYDSDQIDEYAFSLNTLVNYVHYSMTFPTEDMIPLVSGNYLLIVYGDDMSPENLFFTRRFMILDEKATIGANIPRYTTQVSNSDTHQQLNIKAVMPNIMSSNVAQYSNLTIRQNGRWDNAVIGMKPSYVYPEYISYENNPATVFPGTNQYRRFNTSNFYYQSENIAKIRQGNDYYTIDLYPNQSREGKPYLSYEDIHGEKVIYISNDNKDSATEADYAWVNFFLDWNLPNANEQMYILGAISDWNLNEKNKMYYDTQNHGYAASLFLKQGYYNYMYGIVEKGSTEADVSQTAGDYWETNNVYHLYFYYYNPLKGFDELIGYSLINSH